MDFLNESDLNATGSFEAPTEFAVTFPVHLRGYVDAVSVESVPSTDRNELMLLVRGECGYTGAAVRLRDLLRLTLEHYPELVEEVRAELDAVESTGD